MQHHVYFWIKEEYKTAETFHAFEKGLESLIQISTVNEGAYGKPAATADRGAVDNSWDYALVLKFDDVAAHDAYQVHKTHDTFIEQFKDIWANARVSDVQL